MLHPLEYAALLTAARRDGPQSHALVALLAMLGLRVNEACRANVTDLSHHSGELLLIVGKGNKPATIPLPVPVMRAVHDAVGGRQYGAILLNTRGQRLSSAAATGCLHRLARAIRIDHPVSPHSLRRTFCIAGLISGVPYETCSTPCGMPTPAPRCVTTWLAPTSTATPPHPCISRRARRSCCLTSLWVGAVRFTQPPRQGHSLGSCRSLSAVTLIERYWI